MNMYLYSLSLQKATGIVQSIIGSFSAPKTQEILLNKGTLLELCSIDPNTGKLETLISKEVFGQTMKIIPFRLTGNKKDFLVCGSDSGRIVVLEVNLERREFVKIHQETFGKTGVRRIVPGEYLACDPKGRSIMIAAYEKQKFVYIINRDNENRMTISSPLEAHKSRTICYETIGLDVGYNNPLYAALEVDQGDPDDEKANVNIGKIEKMLVYYEMDLGLNHVVRKNYEIVDSTAHLIIPVPGSGDGPGGLILCCENYIVYKRNGHEDRICPLPRRFETSTILTTGIINENTQGVIIVSYGTYKRKHEFFLLIQNELGDLFKVTLNYTGEIVHGVQCEYFDTIPLSVSLNILLSGFLFAASETGNQYILPLTISAVYQIVSLGREEAISTYSTMSQDELVFYNPKELKNLLLVDDIPNLSCVTDMFVDDLTDSGSAQIYSLSGRGPRSTLRVLKQGLSISEIAESNFDKRPFAVWSIKADINDKYDSYVVASFEKSGQDNSTLVLSLHESSELPQNPGFDLAPPTLHVGLLEDNTFIQVIVEGIIHIKTEKSRNLYRTTSRVLSATSNQRQIALALTDRELMYFELDPNGQLNQIEKKVLDNEILCLEIGPIPEGRQRSKFLAIGLADNSIRILSLEPGQGLSKISMQVLPSFASSIALIEMRSTMSYSLENELFLHVGLHNGVLLKTNVDTLTGMLSDTRTRYLGNRPVSLHKVKVKGNNAVLALSSTPWLSYNYMNRYFTSPLNYDNLDFGSSFSSEQCPEGIVAVSGTTLKFFTPERLGDIFSQTIINLRYTPRKMIVNPDTNNIIVIESDCNVLSKSQRDALKENIAKSTNDPDYINLKDDVIGTPFAGNGKWASCIRMIEPLEHKLCDLFELEGNEAAFSLQIVSFSSHPEQRFLIVGTAKDLVLSPRSFSACFIHVFSFVDQGRRIEHLHTTPVEDIPLAFATMEGRLLAAIGGIVRLYDLGKKQLLKKSEIRKITSQITNLQVDGHRVFISTMSESIHVLRYKPIENLFYLVADDVVPRWLTSATLLDSDTIAGCDKFENFFVLRLPPASDEESQEDPMGTKHKWEIGYLQGAAYKLKLLSHFHRGELISSIKKCSLNGYEECLVYMTTMGTIGVFRPLETREDVDFFVHLEMYLRLESPPLLGRDHQAYRSAYGPVKCVVDGDLCEEYSQIEFNKQKVLAFEMDKTPSEIIKKIEEQRTKIL